MEKMVKTEKKRENKGLVINGDEFSFGTEEQFITFIKNKNHININLE